MSVVRVGRTVAIGIIVATALALLGYAGFTVASTVTAMERLKRSVDEVQEPVRSMELTKIQAPLRQTQADAQALNRQTSSFGWQVLQRIPIIGSSAEAVTVTGSAVDRMATAALPLAEALQSEDTNPGRVMAALDSASDLERLADATDVSAQQLAPFATATMLPGTADAIRRAADALPGLASSLRAAAEAAGPLATMLGSDRPTTWLVMSQNPAELRGSGGLFNAYVIVRVSDGQPVIVEAGSRKALDGEFPRAEQIPFQATVDQGTAQTWGPALGEWASFNLPADFPTVARLAAAGMAKRGTPVDGVVAVDPFVVQAILGGTGAVEHKGVTIDGTTAAVFFLKGIYRDYPGFADVQEKDELAMGLTYATIDAAIKRPLDLATLWESISTVIQRGHLKAWSADPASQAWLEETSVSGALDSHPEQVVVGFNNGTGGKLDAYAVTTTQTDTRLCSTTGAVTTKVTIKNDSPDGLPEYVDVSLGQDGQPDPDAIPGQTLTYATAYPPERWRLRGARIDGLPVDPWRGREAGRAAWTIPMLAMRGTTTTAEFVFAPPACPPVR